MKRLIHLLIYVLAALIFVWPFYGCKQRMTRLKANDPEFTAHIAGFTSGTVSSTSSIQVLLSEAYEGFTGPNIPADETLFSFKPELKGHAVWKDARTIEFQPESPMPWGKGYRVRFALAKVKDVPRRLKFFDFAFEVVEQNFSFSYDGYTPLDETDLKWNTVKAVVNSADEIDPEELQSFFTARQKGRKLKMNWESSGNGKSFSCTVDSVMREDSGTEIEINLDASSIRPGMKEKFLIDIPALGDFKVLSAIVVQQPEQHILIRFSDPVKKDQNFEGLVNLSNNITLNYRIKSNEVKVFPLQRMEGSAQLTVEENLVNILGYPLKSEFVSLLAFEWLKPAVRLSGRGTILPSSRGLVFPFEAVNLRAVDVKVIKIFENNIGHFLQVNQLDDSYQLKRAGRLIHSQTIRLDNEPVDLGRWNRFFVDLEKLIKPDPGSIYRVQITFRQSYSLYECGDSGFGSTDFNDEDVNEDDPLEEISYWDVFEDYYDEWSDDYGDYNWEERDDPCTPSYYKSHRWVARNILASDLGILAKIGSDNRVTIAVTNLISAQPVDQAEITLLNYQQQVLAVGKTDKEGFLTMAFSEKPFLLVAKWNKQRGYLRLDEGSSLSLGAFDVTGSRVEKGLKGYIYGERGVWRPGDTLFLTFLLHDRQKVLPQNHPVVFELFNSRGQLNGRVIKSKGHNGFYTHAFPTDQSAPTGNWNLKVKVGGTEFSKILKVESVKPNRLKIQLDFQGKLLSASQEQISGLLTANWLHGSPGSGLRSLISLFIQDTETAFKNYPGFTFHDPSKRTEAEEITVFEGNTDETGALPVSFQSPAATSAPGMLKANFTVRVFERAGDFSIDRFSLPLSPYPAYIGVKAPEGDKRGMLLTDTTHWIQVVSLDENGTPISRKDLEVEIYKLNWRNWWETNDEELPDFMGNTYNQPVYSSRIHTINGKSRFNFRINYPEWGRYLIRVTDTEGGHSTGKIVYVDWPGWAGRPMRENMEAASMLVFNTDKEKYLVGETAQLTIPTGATGRALISIENGTRILSRQWVQAKENEMRVPVKITEDMTPNVYIYVTLIQPHEQSVNDMPIRLYGVIPVLVEDPRTILKPIIHVPKSVEPSQSFTIEISEGRKSEMSYTLAMVEEGLLGLTRFKTPDPWTSFYSREALGVRTHDLYNQVIGAYAGKIGSILGLGGDDEQIHPGDGQKANRFKPVVRFIGPFTLPAGKTNRHRLVMPDYIGSVRMMVVASNGSAFGSAEADLPVKKPLMVLATLPRVLGPGEFVRMPVTVFAMEKSINEVSVSVKTNKSITNRGPASKSVSFANPGEKMLYFDLAVDNKPGVATILAQATAVGQKAEYPIELEIRPSNPPVTMITAGEASSGASWTSSYEPVGMLGTNSIAIELSRIPPLDITRRTRYLIQYPHGCIEQVTSAAMAQLYLAEVMDLSGSSSAAAELNIKTAIRKLQAFQQSHGGMSYWPGSGDVSQWGTSYAGQFLLEAERLGYDVPASLKAAWLKFQHSQAKQWRPFKSADNYRQDDLEQAYRLYTLALAGEPELAAMNRLREYDQLSIQARWRLAASFALAGQLQLAKDMIANTGTNIAPYSGFSSSYGSVERDWAMMLETALLLKDQAIAPALARKISEILSSDRWMSTQSTAFCLFSMARYGKTYSDETLSFAYTINQSKSVKLSSQKAIVKIDLPESAANTAGMLKISNLGKGTLFIRMVREGIPVPGNESAFANGLKLDVNYLNAVGGAIDISRISQGTDFTASVTVTNPTLFAYKDLALTQIFPPGWEIRNVRLDETIAHSASHAITYQDIRDDRIFTYFNLNKAESLTFQIRLTATYPGKYYLPASYCEAMYDNSISALIRGKWVEVNALEP